MNPPLQYKCNGGHTMYNEGYNYLKNSILKLIYNFQLVQTMFLILHFF